MTADGWWLWSLPFYSWPPSLQTQPSETVSGTERAKERAAHRMGSDLASLSKKQAALCATTKASHVSMAAAFIPVSCLSLLVPSQLNLPEHLV